MILIGVSMPAGITSIPYFHVDGGWVVLRAYKVNVDRIINDFQHAMKNNNIFYDDTNSDSLWNEVKKVSYDISKIKEECFTDQYSLIRVCCAYAGVVLRKFDDKSAVEVIESDPCIKRIYNVDLNTGIGLRPGDILVGKKIITIVLSIEADTTVKHDYYPEYKGDDNSIVNALSSVGETDTSMEHRIDIAKANNIHDYRGTSLQNTNLLNLLRAGKLIKL